MDRSNYPLSQWQAFRAFAFKGNVMDLAVGVIIGAAFGKVVDALVKSVIMPLIAVILPTEQSYRDWTVTLEGQVVPYGVFIGEVVNFLIIALVLWLIITKIVRRNAQKEPAPPPPPPAPSKEQELLAEIRDLLRERG